MILLSFSVDSLDAVRLVFNQIQIQSSEFETGTFTTVTGAGFPIDISTGTSPFKVSDGVGEATTWYQSRYYSTDTGQASDWSDPILGDTDDICYIPSRGYYSPEVGYGTSDQLIIDRIRKLIGDPIGLKREYNEKDNIHEGGKVYELSEKGWPCTINVFCPTTDSGTTYTALSDPAVNGYKYLYFSDDITITPLGAELKIDIFYYTFRHSDREIFEVYDTSYPPYPLTVITGINEVYILQTAITLLGQEIIEDSTEDGAIIADEGSRYDNTKAIQFKIDMSDRLQKRLDAVIKALSWPNITGVLID